MSRLALMGVGATGGVGIINDTFTDTNGTSLNAHTIAPVNVPGTSWTELLGDWDIQSNQANAVSFAPPDNRALASVQGNVSDGRCSARVYNGSGNGLAARLTDSNNYWLSFTESFALSIYEVNAGTYTQRASVATSFTPGITVQLECRGTTITTTVGSDSCNYTSTFNQSATRWGIYNGFDGGGGHQLDNFLLEA